MKRAAVLFLLIGGSAFAQERKESPNQPVAAGPGMVVKDGIVGSEEGHAIHELQYWISWGDHDLAEAAYRLGCRDLKSPSLRLLRAWSLLRWSVEKGKDFRRAARALEEIETGDKVLREHVAALLQSLRAVMPCAVCDGKGRIRCTRCHGKGQLDDEDCGACEKGERSCASCVGPRRAPALADICGESVCGLCEGRGLPLKAVRIPCGECRGLGRKLVPKADPSKTLR